MIPLSPAARRGIFHHLIARDTAEEVEARDKLKRKQGLDRIERVTCYRCLECESLHDCEEEAMDCCDPDGEVQGLHDEEVAERCPVCGGEYLNPFQAADCCLWKDIDAATRWRMASRVDAGATWAEVLGVAA